MEEWRTVPGTDGYLEVSNEGRVRSLLRGKPYVLKTVPDNRGYLRLRMVIYRESKTYKIHRLVAQAFVDNPENLPQVNHIDGNKQNNNASNLEWVTNKQNARHALENGLWDTFLLGTMRENESRKKRIVGHYNGHDIHFKSVSEAERYLNSRHISDVLKGKRQHVKGWTFEYERG